MPENIQDQLNILYGFLSSLYLSAHNDAVPTEYFRLKNAYKKACLTDNVDDDVIDEFIKLEGKFFDPEWTHQYFKSLELIMNTDRLSTLEESDFYLYGTAEVPAKMVGKILGLHPDLLYFAAAIGKAIGHLSNINNAFSNSKNCISIEVLEEFGLNKLDPETVTEKAESYEAFIHHQIKTYYQLIEEGEEGFEYLSQRTLLPIKNIIEQYNWIADKIDKNPLLILNAPIKPSKRRILYKTMVNAYRVNL